ncbi:hypothetical protein ABW365_05385 [Enterococcus avium]
MRLTENELIKLPLDRFFYSQEELDTYNELGCYSWEANSKPIYINHYDERHKLSSIHKQDNGSIYGTYEMLVMMGAMHHKTLRYWVFSNYG